MCLVVLVLNKRSHFFTHLVAELDSESVALLNEYKKKKEKNINDLGRFSH